MQIGDCGCVVIALWAGRPVSSADNYDSGSGNASMMAMVMLLMVNAQASCLN